jgi:hypothetical protein
MTDDMQSRIVGRFLTAADDPKKLLQKGMDDPGLKHVKRAWDDFVKDVAEAQRQYNSVGGAHPTSVINELVSKFIHRPLKDLGEEATGWAKRIGKIAKTASDKTAGYDVVMGKKATYTPAMVERLIREKGMQNVVTDSVQFGRKSRNGIAFTYDAQEGRDDPFGPHNRSGELLVRHFPTPQGWAVEVYIHID